MPVVLVLNFSITMDTMTKSCEVSIFVVKAGFKHNNELILNKQKCQVYNYKNRNNIVFLLTYVEPMPRSISPFIMTYALIQKL